MKIMSIKKMLIAFIVMLILIVSGRVSAYASLYDNRADRGVDDYNNYINYSAYSSCHGLITYTVTSDISKVDTLNVPYALVVEKCCSNPRFPNVNYVEVIINGRTAYHSGEMALVDMLLHSKVEEHTVDVKAYRSSNASITFNVNCQNLICENCGQNQNTQCVFTGLWFMDYRARAYVSTANANVDYLGSYRMEPRFSDRTSSIAWAVRYPGESGYTFLNEGTNRDGLVATGVTSRAVEISNVPCVPGGFDLGVFVYDDEGDLPGGTQFPYTPFFTHINVTDNIKPQIEVKKTIDSSTKSVIVTITGTDNVGLHDTPYSWDGGNTFEANGSKAFTEPGTYTVGLRDSSGNVITKDVHIDAIEIEKANPKAESVDKITEKDTGSGHGGSSGSGGTSTGSGTSGNAGNVGNPSTGTGSLNGVTSGPANYSGGDKNITDGFNSKDTAKGTNANGAIGNDVGKGTNSKGSGSLTPSKISDKKAEDAFEKIRNNSEEYIISMKENIKEENKLAPAAEANINLENIDESDDMASEYSDEGNSDSDVYTPENSLNSGVIIAIIVVAVFLFVLLLMFILFFGVIIYIEKETEYSILSDSEGIKLPVAISFVTRRDDEFAVCFRELLNKYGVVYARFGVLFAYMYEGEKIKILTKFKGEDKKEIATEKIHREIIVGNKGGRK